MFNKNISSKFNSLFFKALFVGLLAAFSLNIAAQKKACPTCAVNKRLLLDVVKSKTLRTDEIVAVIEKRGADFQLTPAVANELKNANAPAAVIEAVRQNYRASNNKADDYLFGGVVNAKAINLVVPAYPPAARAVGASGIVRVLVTIDENGDIVSATAAIGHPLLRSATEMAARASKFKPTLVNGKAVQINGVLEYKFSPN